jgi:glycosyltransferase involved in cell wall biosynthesis
MNPPPPTPRRICIIADALDEPYAGVTTYARELIAELLRLDHRHALTFLHIRPNPLLTGQPEILVPANRRNPLDILVRKIVRIPAIMRRERFDLVHDLFHFPPFAFRALPSACVVTLHDLTPVLFPQWHPRMTVWMHRLFLPAVIRRATRIIADSAATGQDIARRYGRYAPVIRCIPLAARRFAPPPPRRDPPPPFILFVGTLEPRKNLATLLDAYDQVRAGGESVRLVLIGQTGWLADDGFRRIRRSRFVNDIQVMGSVDESVLAWHYHHAAALVYPSWYEGFGLPVLEAMQCGCPVVASNRSSLPQIVGDAGLLVDPAQAGAVADAIRRVLNEPGLREQLARRGRERARTFSWERTARETWAVYEEALEAWSMA